MNQGILATFNSLLDDDLIAEASETFGESQSAVGTTLRLAGPAMLAGIAKNGSSRDDISELLAGMMSTSADEDVESELLSAVFGIHVDRIAGALSPIVGLKPDSVRALLAFAVSMLGVVMKSFVADRGLNAQGLASALAQERDSLARVVVDPTCAAAMGIDTRRTGRSFSGTPGRHAEPTASSADYAGQGWIALVDRRSSWRPWALGAAAAVLGLLLIVSPWSAGPERPTAAMSIDFDRAQASVDSDERLALGVAAATVQANAGLAAPRGRDSRSQFVPPPAPTLLAVNIDDLTNLELFCVATFSVAVVYFVVGSIQSLKDGRPARRRRKVCR